MHIGGTLVTAMVRIVVLAATLALVYFFILKPILETTERVTGSVQDSIQKSLDSVNEAFDQSNLNPAAENRIRREIRGGRGTDHRRLLRCVQRAGQNVARIQSCASRFGP